jgi:processive 1,2-diacylglycerol beta-glucosyltransferase
VKVLVAYASAGLGHKVAAEAVCEYLNERFPDATIRIVDILQFVSPYFKISYSGSYLFLTRYLPLVWGMVFSLFDQVPLLRIIAGLRSCLNRLFSKRFIDLVLRFRPDIIISTHFFPTNVVSSLKRRRQFKNPLITVVTDFYVHGFWISEETDLYIVMWESTKRCLLEHGISIEKIHAIGIPVRRAFLRESDKGGIIRKYGLDEERRTILVLCGGFGVGPVVKVVKSLERLKEIVQVVVVCGRSKRLKKRVDKVIEALGIRAVVFGFVDNISELMDVADFCITKAGALTLCETLSKDLPVFIVEPIPGQERRNAVLLSEGGASVIVEKADQVGREVEKFILNPKLEKEIKARICVFSHPQAGTDLATEVTRLVIANKAVGSHAKFNATGGIGHCRDKKP